MAGINKTAYFFFLLFTLTGQAQSQTYLDTLKQKSDFDNFCGMPLSSKYGQVVAVKVVYDLQTEQLYFINSKYYKYHHEFCQGTIESQIELDNFNAVNYSDLPERRYLLGNVNYFKTINQYVLELSPVDQMPFDLILKFDSIVSGATYFGKDMKFLSNSVRLQNLENKLKNKLDVIKPSDIYYNLTYQCIGKYTNTGVLRFIDNMEAEASFISSKDIIVLNEMPKYFAQVSGIIVTKFQTPLSHLSILAQNRKIPICAYKHAFEDSILRKYANKKIKFSVKSDTFLVVLTKNIEKKVEDIKKMTFTVDLTVDSLIEVKYLSKNSSEYVGNKAENFGFLNSLSSQSSFKVPESAFAIPFYFYNQHIEKSRAKSFISGLINNKSDQENVDSLKNKLKNIRTEIIQTPIDEAFLKTVEDRIRKLGNYSRMRFRSSTNAEDAEGFSGAGLYESYTGELGNEKQSVEKAIKKVWASLWSFEAYSERNFFNIDHESVYMGVLVHRSFPDEQVNGVAITKNPYRRDSYGFLVNAQLGDESVVKPKEGNMCDQFICYPNNANVLYKNKTIIDVISVSNLNNNNLLMSEKEIQNLANQLARIKKYFMKQNFITKSYFDFGLDVEFKLDGEKRELYFKQVRIYND
jgi:pyruvate, water dikinase